jgi:hypothetical protein
MEKVEFIIVKKMETESYFFGLLHRKVPAYRLMVNAGIKGKSFPVYDLALDTVEALADSFGQSVILPYHGNLVFSLVVNGETLGFTGLFPDGSGPLKGKEVRKQN